MATIPTSAVVDAIAHVGRLRTRPVVAAPTELAALIDHVVAVHHASTRGLLAALAVLADELATAAPSTGVRLPAAVAALAAILAPHLAKEERVLFAYLRGADVADRPAPPFASLDAPLRVLEQEHAAARAAIAALVAVTRPALAAHPGDPVAEGFADAVAALADDLARHIHLEETTLFPAARHREHAGPHHRQEPS